MNGEIREQDQSERVKNEVVALLAQYNIPTEKWGTGSAKTLDHLVKEVVDGETVLEVDESGELVRKISVAFVDVYYDDATTGKKLILVEEKQVFKDGRERRREPKASLAEKIKPGETPDQDAVRRAIQEELGISGPIPAAEKRREENTKETGSYPGLKMDAMEYYFDVELNSEQYNPEGYVEHQEDKDTYFKWVKLEE
ncbi:MAG: NUDIX domain-containing protein [Candidatus Staskawiczbacteria bacterium]|nr:NUDIX domain-containing protein [Candidatus Staskawiczbacteria bacterium]